MLGCLRRALGELEDIQVDLDWCHAAQAAVYLFASEDAGVVRADQLDVRALGSAPDAERVGERSTAGWHLPVRCLNGGYPAPIPRRANATRFLPSVTAVSAQS
jgi:hypothetical protein